MRPKVGSTIVEGLRISSHCIQVDNRSHMHTMLWLDNYKFTQNTWHTRAGISVMICQLSHVSMVTVSKPRRFTYLCLYQLCPSQTRSAGPYTSTTEWRSTPQRSSTTLPFCSHRFPVSGIHFFLSTQSHPLEYCLSQSHITDTWCFTTLWHRHMFIWLCTMMWWSQGNQF